MMTELNEDDKVQIQINKVKAQMGVLRHVFACNSIDMKAKYWVYAAGHLNTLLWGCESWNMTERNLKHLSSFHHKAIKRLLGLKWEKVKEKKNANELVRHCFNNIPNIETYIIRRTSRYMGKVIRSEKNNIPWKLLGAWIFTPRKIGRPQNSCNNNVLITINALIPEVEKDGNFQSATPLTGEESTWNSKFDIFFVESQDPDSDDGTKNAEPLI